VIEDAGRQRLASYYLYSALLAGVIGDGGLGTRLVQARIEADRDEADVLGGVERELSALRAETAREVADLQTPRRA
jgi:hypothetical protein